MPPARSFCPLLVSGSVRVTRQTGSNCWKQALSLIERPKPGEKTRFPAKDDIFECRLFRPFLVKSVEMEHFTGSALKPSIYIDGREVTRTKNGS
jgi:hypothetical protein